MKVGFDIENKEQVIQWLEKLRKGTGDARPLWIAMYPKIVEFVNYEFHDSADTHKLWPALDSKYKRWKQLKGFSIGMGVMTGKMRTGAGKEAKKVLKEDSLLWILNQTNVRSKKGYRYAPVFNFGRRDGSQPARKIYKYTALRISSFLKLDAKKFESGVTHASFTYNWLRKAFKEAGLK